MTEGWTGFTPILRVKDAEASIDFYCNVLGFNKDRVHRFEEDFPAYASVSRGPLIAHLSEHGAGDIEEASLLVIVPDVDSVYEEFTKNGLSCDPPVSQPEIGLRSFEFNYPDGHRIEFGRGPTEDEAKVD